MNTNEVARLLGVSASTIQRWVKQLELPMERNERGHYHFNNEDIDLLKNIQTQIQNGTLLQEIAPVQERKTRKGTVKAAPENNSELERLYSIVTELETKVNSKADSVASYQLLQHRREIEELQSQVIKLTKQVENLQSQLQEFKTSNLPDKPLVLDQGKLNRKKKNFVSSLFGFLG
ncbi:MerR family transcriptional regulator [Neobacillus sp. CF12]|uniref:MerR family transcriptional regulator n=1 Tax=Neobacillus sp. CF12 TaxID=3055864 RepID=UPI0025A046A2|nr:MerR family transcriptional regulator [Neobacillus sp. CF12]MDM5331488.1 MerR family transcriptional regulator [Neobacillus sp. CF12]